MIIIVIPFSKVFQDYCFFFFLPSTSLWGVYSETFIHRYSIPLTHAFTNLCMIFFPSHVHPALCLFPLVTVHTVEYESFPTINYCNDLVNCRCLVLHCMHRILALELKWKVFIEGGSAWTERSEIRPASGGTDRDHIRHFYSEPDGHRLGSIFTHLVRFRYRCVIPVQLGLNLSLIHI